MRKSAALAIVSIITLLAGYAMAAQDEMKEVPAYAPPGKVIGMSVRDAQGQPGGHLENVIFDWSTSRIRYGVISYEGNSYYVPWSAVTFDEDNDSLRLKIDRETVVTSPRVKAGTPISRATSIKIHEHYSLAPYWEDTVQDKPRTLSPSVTQPGYPSGNVPAKGTK